MHSLRYFRTVRLTATLLAAAIPASTARETARADMVGAV